MKRISQLRWVVLLSILLPLVCFGLTQAVPADGTVTLGISPQILELSANPGESQTSTFRLTNASKEAVVIKTTAKNFTPRGEEGAIDLTEIKTTYSLADWLTTTPSSVTIAPSATEDFVVTVNVPKDAEPGSHFGSVVFQTVPPEQKGTAALVSQEIAPVILVKVAGDIHESGQIASFKPAQHFYSLEKNIEIKSRIKNTGNVHFKPSGTIIIKNMFGHEVATLQLDKKNVLPDSIRDITTAWQPSGFTVGRYHATLTLVTGSDNSISTAETNIIVFPYQIIVPAIVILVLLTYTLYRGRERLSDAAKALRGKQPGK